VPCRPAASHAPTRGTRRMRSCPSASVCSVPTSTLLVSSALYCLPLWTYPAFRTRTRAQTTARHDAHASRLERATFCARNIEHFDDGRPACERKSGGRAGRCWRRRVLSYGVGGGRRQRAESEA
jgi:hypothetical protein